MTESPLRVEWLSRCVPLVPTAVAARAEAAKVLAHRLLARDAVSLAALSGVAGGDLLIVLGSEEALPWVEGVVYLGRDPAAPSLLMPTTRVPSVPPALLERALPALYSQLPPPLAVLPAFSCVASLAAARPIDREVLKKWLDNAL